MASPDATIWNEYARPLIGDVTEVVVIVSPLACEVKVRVALAILGVVPKLSVTRKVIALLNAVVVAPEMTPLLLKERPVPVRVFTYDGSIVQTYGPTPPFATSC